MNLFNGYCYSDPAILADAMASSFSPVGPVSGVTIGTNSASIQVTSTSSLTGQTDTLTYTQLIPACSNPGPLTNASGLSIADVTQASWLVVLVWASVWSVKVIRRGL